MAHSPQPMRQINIRVSEKVYANLEKLAKAADASVSTYCGYLFDAAYAARVKGTPDAELDAHVALVGLGMLRGVEIDQIATGSGLSIEIVERIRDGWKSVLAERRRGS